MLAPRGPHFTDYTLQIQFASSHKKFHLQYIYVALNLHYDFIDSAQKLIFDDKNFDFVTSGNNW